MLIDAFTDIEVSRTDRVTRWRLSDTHLIGWRGNPFVRGEAAGEASIAWLQARLRAGAGAELFQELDGIYGLFILDRCQRSWDIVVDNSGLYRLFYRDGRVGTSFLELIRAAGSSTPDDAALVEFVMHGGNFGAHTPVKEIRKLRRDQILRLTAEPAPRMALLDKPVAVPGIGPDAPSPDEEDALVERYFDAMAAAIAARAVSVDLTGGFDTRAIACLLDRRGLPFECALSGMPETVEHRTALRVAETMGRPFHYHIHDIGQLEADLPRVFLTGDGLTEIPRLHRDTQLCLARQARGIEIMLHGGGGGFFQDHYVVQDFPRYAAPKANVARYYRLRIAPIPLPAAQLTPAGARTLQAVRDAVIARFEQCREATNNRTYERIAYEYRAPEFYGATFTNYINMGMDVEAPFLNHRMIGVAMRMSPWRRLFMGWHRRIISRSCPKLAALRTADGYTASDRRGQILKELGGYALVQASRVGRKLGERYLGKSLFHQVGELEADAPGYRDRLRNSALFAAALERLKAQGLIEPGLQPQMVRNIHVGRMITMGTLLRYLDGADIGRL